MQTLKKFVASLSALAIVLAQNVSLVTYAQSIPQQYVDAHTFAWENGLTSMSTPEAFMPFSTLTREALSRFAVKSAELLGAATVEGQNCTFTDIDSADQTLVSFINDSCAKYGIMKGFAGKFMPKVSVNRAQAITVISRMLYGNQYDSTDAEYWKFHAQRLLEDGIITVVNPDQLVIRGDFALMAKRAREMKNGGSDDLSDLLGDLLNGGTGSQTGSGGVQQIVKSGNLGIALNASTYPARSVPMVGIVPAGKFDFTAGGADIQLMGVKVERTGLGDKNEIQRIYFEKNGVRVSSRGSIGTDGYVSLSFVPAFVIKAGATEILDLVVELSGSIAGSEHQFVIRGADRINSSAQQVTANYPLMTNRMSTANYTVAAVTFEGLSSSASQYNVGDMQREIGRFRLINTNSERPVVFQSVTLRNNGTAELTNLGNLKVYDSSNNVVSADVVYDGTRDVTIKINAVELLSSQTKLFTIKADINDVDNVSGDTVTFELRNNNDINIVEKSTVFRTSITRNPSTAGTYTIKGGALILTQDTSLINVETVSPGMTDVVLFQGTLKSNQNITIEDPKIRIELNTGSLASVFSRVRLMIGVQEGTFTIGSSITSSGYTGTIDGTFSVNGEMQVKILADTRSSFNGTVNAQVKSFTFRPGATFAPTLVEYQSNENQVDGNDVIGEFNGRTITVSASKLTFTVIDGTTAKSYVRGANGRTLLGIRIKNIEGSPVTVSRMTFDVRTGANTVDAKITNNNNNLTTNLSGLQASDVIDTAGQLIYDGVSFTLAAGEERLVTMYGNIGQSWTGSTFAVHLSSVDATDANGNTVTVSTGGVKSALYTIVDNAILTINKHSSSPSATLFPSNSPMTEILRLSLDAQFDQIQVNKLYFYNGTGINPVLFSRIADATVTDANGNVIGTLSNSLSSSGLSLLEISFPTPLLVDAGVAPKEIIVKIATSSNITNSGDLNANYNLALAIGTGASTASFIDTQAVAGVKATSVSVANYLPAAGIVLGSTTGDVHRFVNTALRVTKQNFGGSAAASNIALFDVTAIGGNAVKLTGFSLSGTAGYILTSPSLEYSTNGGATYSPVPGFGGCATLGCTVTLSTPFQINQGSTVRFRLTAANSGTTRQTRMISVDFRDVFNDGDISLNGITTPAGLPTDFWSFTP